jgi:hypothetical protein
MDINSLDCRLQHHAALRFYLLLATAPYISAPLFPRAPPCLRNMAADVQLCPGRQFAAFLVYLYAVACCLDLCSLVTCMLILPA